MDFSFGGRTHRVDGIKVVEHVVPRPAERRRSGLLNRVRRFFRSRPEKSWSVRHHYVRDTEIDDAKPPKDKPVDMGDLEPAARMIEGMGWVVIWFVVLGLLAYGIWFVSRGFA